MIDFKNTQIAFESKTNVDLQRAKILFECMQRSWLVKIGKFAAEFASAIHFPIAWALKPTIYRQFVGGENLEECALVAEKLAKSGVYSIFDNSVEGGGTEKAIQANFDEAIRSIKFTQERENVAYAVFKPTALAPADLLEKASSGEELTENEKAVYQRFQERFENLCKYAHELNIRILVDAESYCYQNEIDRMTEKMMRRYNKKHAIVFTTLQMYRHDRMKYLEFLLDDAVKNDYIVGMKFVRGAYMEKERARAKKLGYLDPICPTKEATDENYDNGLRFTIEHIDRFEVFNGTHNEKSNFLLADLLQQHNIEQSDKRIFFAQLYGMSDNLSYNLSKAGYNVAKYVPYAPVKDVLPYLIRRAEENTSIAGQTSRELDLIRTEVKRRKLEIRS
ncbi:MAG: proline dehydrogenase family protein [Prevotellaceae bacterium]|jgi:proline dehydrogenase|nr:proline dehydrogenase family protein [Prevotellaceae bacterium]